MMKISGFPELSTARSRTPHARTANGQIVVQNILALDSKGILHGSGSSFCSSHSASPYWLDIHSIEELALPEGMFIFSSNRCFTLTLCAELSAYRATGVVSVPLTLIVESLPPWLQCRGSSLGSVVSRGNGSPRGYRKGEGVGIEIYLSMRMPRYFGSKMKSRQACLHCVLATKYVCYNMVCSHSCEVCRPRRTCSKEATTFSLPITDFKVMLLLEGQ